LAALYAARQVRIAREQAAETRQAQLEASRPYVIVTIEPSGASQHLFDLVVKNVSDQSAKPSWANSAADSLSASLSSGESVTSINWNS